MVKPAEHNYWSDKSQYEDLTDKGYSEIIEYCQFPNGYGLDVGCATGALSSRIDSRVIGIDISESLLKNCPFPSVCGSADKLPFQDNVFDWVLYKSSLHHIEHKEKSVRESYRCLKPNGLLVVIEPNVYHPHRWLIQNTKLFRRILGKNLVPGEEWKRSEYIRAMLFLCGFTELSFKYFSPIYKPSVLSRLQRLYGMFPIPDKYSTFKVASISR